jgi:hypothetical protein
MLRRRQFARLAVAALVAIAWSGCASLFCGSLEGTGGYGLGGRDDEKCRDHAFGRNPPTPDYDQDLSNGGAGSGGGTPPPE